jgi:hypothetical protein
MSSFNDTLRRAIGSLAAKGALTERALSRRLPRCCPPAKGLGRCACMAKKVLAKLARDGILKRTIRGWRPTNRGRAWLYQQGSPPAKRGFLPGKTKKGERLSVDGFEVTYYEPRYGMITFRVKTHHELAEDKVWLDAGGYMYRVKPFTEGSPISTSLAIRPGRQAIDAVPEPRASTFHKTVLPIAGAFACWLIPSPLSRR